MTADVVEMRAEADRIGQRRPDAIRPTTAGTCPSHAALLHRVASLITTEELPPAKVTVTPAAEVLVDASGGLLVENTVRRYADAIGQTVTETPVDVSGWAATQWSASGYLDSVWFHIVGCELHPTPVTDRFGCGIGPAT